MIGKSSHSQIRPAALGTTLQSATYGQTIPVIYGRTKGALYLIWSANLRKQGSKGAKIAQKFGKAMPNYVENVDFLIGHNPIITVLSFWQNQTQRLPLDFSGLLTTSVVTIGVPDNVTIADDNFYAVLGVTVTDTYDVTFDDYGGQGSQHLTGSYEIPAWNAAFGGPNPTNNTRSRGGLYYYWSPANGNVVHFPADVGWGNGKTVKIYYAKCDPAAMSAADKALGVDTGIKVPASALNLTFEPTLGDGPEFTGFFSGTSNPLVTQRILYPHYAGLGSEAFVLGGSVMPNTSVEVLGAYPIYPTGDADYADMVEDLMMQGQSQAAVNVDTVARWAALQGYSQGATILDPNDHWQMCTFPGTTGSSEPTFNSTGGTTTDGSVTWQDLGKQYSPESGFTGIQRGLNCYDFPGLIQKACMDGLFGDNKNHGSYYVPNTKGNILIVFATRQEFSPQLLTISDTPGDTWTPIITDGTLDQGCWYTTTKGSQYTSSAVPATNTVEIGPDGNHVQDYGLTLLEFAGLDTVENVYTAAGTADEVTASIAVSNKQGEPGFILAIISNGFDNTPPAPTSVLWKNEIPDAMHRVDSRIVYTPGTYSVTYKFGTNKNYRIILMSFKNSQPVNYPRPLGNILDDATMQLTRNQCRAAGLYGSFNVDSQQKASDYLGQLYDAMDAAPVWSGFTLKSIPRSEVSNVGNGAIYTAPTASGPVANLKESDFIFEASESPVTVDRKAQVDLPNILQIQHPSRDADYNDVIVMQPDAGSIALYGPRKDSPKQFRMVQDPAVARMILGILVRRQNYLRNSYKFKLKAKWKLLEPMDLITIPVSCTMPDSDNSVPSTAVIPVRLTRITEDADYSLDCEAEPFIYGVHSPLPYNVTAQSPGSPGTGESSGDINAPIIFEPPVKLSGVPAPADVVWIVVSNDDPNYGGCVVYLSTSGPEGSYVSIGSILGSAAMGPTTADWPASADPDTSNDLAVDLTESNGVLESYTTQEEDAFLYPCYVSTAENAPPAATSKPANGAGVNPDIALTQGMVAAYLMNGTSPDNGGNQLNSVTGVDALEYTAGTYGVNIESDGSGVRFPGDSSKYTLPSSVLDALNGKSTATLVIGIQDDAQTNFNVTHVTGDGTHAVYTFEITSGPPELLAGMTCNVSGCTTSGFNFTGGVLVSVDKVNSTFTVANSHTGSENEATATGKRTLLYLFDDPAEYHNGWLRMGSSISPDHYPYTDGDVYTDAFNTTRFQFTPDWDPKTQQNIVITCDFGAGQWKLYAGAALKATQTPSGPSVDLGDALLGQTASTFVTEALKGKILYFYLWDRVLTSGEITTLNANPWAVFGPTVYELMTYADAELTGTDQYSLKATGTGNKLRRAVFGVPSGGGVDHPSGSLFAFLGPTGNASAQGILKTQALKPGVMNYLKFTTFNAFGGGMQNLADVTVYRFTPSGTPAGGGGGVPGPNSYIQTPAVALTQPTGTTIHMDAISVQFSTGTVSYNERTLTISEPSVPTIYYVMIVDPSYIGDANGDLAVLCETSQDHVGVPGYTYVGYVQAIPGGGAAAISTAGGWPPPFGVVVES